jgi:hypothetical protein
VRGVPAGVVMYGDLSFDDYLSLVEDNHYNNAEWRFGQSAVNTLYQVRPELAQVMPPDLEWLRRNWQVAPPAP